MLSGQQDSNLRPPAPKAGALAGLRYAPIFSKNFFLIIGFWRCKISQSINITKLLSKNIFSKTDPNVHHPIFALIHILLQSLNIKRLLIFHTSENSQASFC